MALQTQVVELPDNSIDGGPKQVKVRMLTALDEILSVKILGKEIRGGDDSDATNIMQGEVLVALSIVEEDGVAVTPPKTMDEFFLRLSKFTMPSWQKVFKAFKEVNGDSETLN